MKTIGKFASVLALLSAVSFYAAGSVIDVTTLGAKNDGSADVSDIVNAATKRAVLCFPAGVYKVSKPLRLKNSVRGDGFSRISKVTSNETWFVSAIESGKPRAGVVEIERNVKATVENLSIRCCGNVDGIRIADCTQGNMLYISRVGIFGVSSCGLFVEGSGSRPVFVGDLTVWGDPHAMTRSVGVRMGGACDCRLANVEIMGVAVGIEAFNGHTYGDNLHLWTGFLGAKSDPDAWWVQTRGLVLGCGANFTGSNVYPDTSYYAVEFRGPGGTCSIGNIMYWEDGSVRHVKNRTGAFLCPDADAAGRLVVHGGLVGVTGTDAKPGAMSRVYSPRQTFAGVMMKCEYAIKADNLDRICLGGDLPDYTVSYRTNGFCKVADILTPARSGSCAAKIVRDDGAAWYVDVVKSSESVDACVRTANALGTDADVRVAVIGDHVKVFLLAPTGAKGEWTARFTTSHMCDYCRPVDHGSLRHMNGTVRYREFLNEGSKFIDRVSLIE